MLRRSQPGSQTARRVASPTSVLAIVSSGVLLASLDLFIVNVALPRIARDLRESNLGELSWVLNAYAIVYAALLVFFGRLADRYRRDHAFLLGIGVFIAGSAGCAASVNVGMLIGFRVVQAIGAALLTPTSLGLLLATFPPERRGSGVRAWTAVGGVAAALGPVVGGFLVAVDWRWVFLVNVPLGIAALVAGRRLLPAVPGHPIERPDPLGVLLLTVGVGLLVLGLVEGSDWGWASPRLLTALVIAGVLLAGFAVHSRTSATPLVHPGLFRSRSFTGASVLAVVFSASFGAMLLTIILWEQGIWGWSALRSGLAIAPGPLMVPLVSFTVVGRLIARWGPGPVTAAGSVLFAAGTAWWALATTARPAYASSVLAGMILTGVGVGLTLPTMMSTAAGSLPPHAFATGTAVVNMLRQTGIAVGVAIAVAVLGRPHADTFPVGQFHRMWWVISAISLAGVLPALTMPAGERPEPVAEQARADSVPVG